MIKTVAVGTDGSGTASKAVAFAIELAEKFGARLVVISSYKPVSGSRLADEQSGAPEDVQWAINPSEDVDGIFADVVNQARTRNLQTTTVAREGDPAEVLCQCAEDENADVLVIGNKGMQRRILGSVPNSVAHKAPCSVLVVKTT